MLLLLTGQMIAGQTSRAQSSTAPSPTASSSHALSKNDSVFKTSELSSFRLSKGLSGTARRRLFALPPAATSGRMRMFVFLSPECPLCQNYSVKLNELNRRYAGKVMIYGIIPGKAYTTAEILAFAGKYKIGFPVWIDESLRLSRYLQVTTTPEVILLDSRNELLYKGAIDNWYKALGKARTRTTENYLQDAIDHALRQEPSPIKRVTPVGCYLNDF